MGYFVYELGENGKGIGVELIDDENKARLRFDTRREEQTNACLVFIPAQKLAAEKRKDLEKAAKAAAKKAKR